MALSPALVEVGTKGIIYGFNEKKSSLTVLVDNVLSAW